MPEVELKYSPTLQRSRLPVFRNHFWNKEYTASNKVHIVFSWKEMFIITSLFIECDLPGVLLHGQYMEQDFLTIPEHLRSKLFQNS